jgi:hypothetical protein
MKTVFEFEIFGIRFIVERPLTPGEKAKQEFCKAHLEYVCMPNWLAEHTKESMQHTQGVL